MLLALSGTLIVALAAAAPPATEPAAAAPVAPAVADVGKDEFTPLFNGADLAGWIGDTKGYAVEAGAIVCGPAGTNLYTQREYGDFVLRFEFQLAPGANNGIGIRAPASGDPAYEGMEIQVLDDSDPKYRDLQPWQFHGSVYGIVAAERGHLKPVGSWNEEEIRVEGRRVTITLNGAVIVDADLDAATSNGTLSGRDHPGLKRSSGHIALCGHGDRVLFRSLRIKELLPTPKP